VYLAWEVSPTTIFVKGISLSAEAWEEGEATFTVIVGYFIFKAVCGLPKS